MANRSTPWLLDGFGNFDISLGKIQRGDSSMPKSFLSLNLMKIEIWIPCDIRIYYMKFEPSRRLRNWSERHKHVVPEHHFILYRKKMATKLLTKCSVYCSHKIMLICMITYPLCCVCVFCVWSLRLLHEFDHTCKHVLYVLCVCVFCMYGITCVSVCHMFLFFM